MVEKCILIFFKYIHAVKILIQRLCISDENEEDDDDDDDDESDDEEEEEEEEEKPEEAKESKKRKKENTPAQVPAKKAKVQGLFLSIFIFPLHEEQLQVSKFSMSVITCFI